MKYIKIAIVLPYIILSACLSEAYCADVYDQKTYIEIPTKTIVSQPKTVFKLKTQIKKISKLKLIHKLDDVSQSGQSLEMIDYINKALIYSPDIKERISNREESYNLLKQSLMNTLPVITASAGIGSQYSNPATSTVSSRYGTEKLSVNLHQNIFGEGKITDVKMNKSIIRSSDEELDQIKNLISLFTIEAYLNVIRYKITLEIQEESIAAHELVAIQTKSRLDAGISRLSDWSLAKGRLASEKASLSSTKSRLQRSYAILFRHTGLNIKGDLTDIRVSFSNIIPRNFDEAWKIAIEKNSNLKAKFHEIATAKHAKTKDLLNLYPSLSIDASATKNYDSDGIQGVDEDLSAMLNMKYTFNFGSRIYKHRSAASRVKLKKYEYKKLQSDVYQNLSSLYSDYENLSTEILFMEASRDHLNKVVINHEREFLAGFRGLFDLLNTKSEYFDSRIQYINAMYDKKIIAFNILANTGLLLNYFEDINAKSFN
ncbi:MAG: adhesin transport system outer membrane protein [Myxococcota bacterium]|jgi:adhesin transport system outer membrane protein